MASLRTSYLRRSAPPHLSTLIILVGLGAMSMNIFLPSLPQIAAHFDAAYSQVQFLIAGYLMASGVVQLMIGPVADRYGRRPVILGALLVFLVASVGCLLAPSFGLLLACRIVQATAVIGMAMGRAAVRDIHTGPKATSAMAYVMMGVSIVPMISPAIGGLLAELFGWQAGFWVMLIGGLLVFALCWLDFGETARPSDLSLLRQFAEYPELLRSRRFWGFALACTAGSGAWFSYLGGAPYVGSTVFGLSPAQFGIATAAPAVGYFAGNWFTGKTGDRLGASRTVLLGMACMSLPVALAWLLASWDLSTPASFFGLMVFIGLGNGMVIPASNAGMLSVRPHLAGTASGLGGALMIGGGGVLASIAGRVLGPGRNEAPLLLLMLVLIAIGAASILTVIRRERQLSLTPTE